MPKLLTLLKINCTFGGRRMNILTGRW